MFHFDSLENIRKSNVFWYFQGNQKGTLGRKGLIKLQAYIRLTTSIMIRVRFDFFNWNLAIKKEKKIEKEGIVDNSRIMLFLKVHWCRFENFTICSFHIKTIPSKFILRFLELFSVKFVFFLKSRLLFNKFYCFCMLINKHI